MKYILTVFIFLFICIGLSAQVKNPKFMTPQDSTAAAQAEANKFVDSVMAKVTIKEFLAWLDDGVSGKLMREGSFSTLWNIFIQAKYNEWMLKKKKN